jgi:hypothetical protein
VPGVRDQVSGRKTELAFLIRGSCTADYIDIGTSVHSPNGGEYNPTALGLANREVAGISCQNMKISFLIPET